MHTIKFTFVILFLPLLYACQKEVPRIFATDRCQISNATVVEAKLSRHGKYSALLLSSNTLELWHNGTRQKVSFWDEKQLVPNTSMVNLSENAAHILTANKKVVQIWHAEAESSLGTLDLTEHLGDANITQVRFWFAPYRFLVGTSGGDIFFADIESNSYRVNRTHTGDVTKIIFNENKQAVYSGGNDGQVIKWDLINYRPLKSRHLPHRITSLAVSSDDIVFISDALKEQVIWDSTHDKLIGELAYWTQFQWFRQAKFASGNKWLITSSPKIEMYLWKLQDMSLQGNWSVEAQGLGSTVADMAVLQRDKLRTLSTDGVLQAWDLAQLFAPQNQAR